jgi:hypothetical protein
MEKSSANAGRNTRATRAKSYRRRAPGRSGSFPMADRPPTPRRDSRRAGRPAPRREAGLAASLVDQRADGVDGQFAVARDFLQRLPHRPFQAQTRAFAADPDIAIEQSAVATRRRSRAPCPRPRTGGKIRHDYRYEITGTANGFFLLRSFASLGRLPRNATGKWKYSGRLLLSVAVARD